MLGTNFWRFPCDQSAGLKSANWWEPAARKKKPIGGLRPQAAVGPHLAGGSVVLEADIQRAELEFDKFSVGGR